MTAAFERLPEVPTMRELGLRPSKSTPGTAFRAGRNAGTHRQVEHGGRAAGSQCARRQKTGLVPAGTPERFTLLLRTTSLADPRGCCGRIKAD
jgi:hypothetical protein